LQLICVTISNLLF